MEGAEYKKYYAAIAKKEALHKLIRNVSTESSKQKGITYYAYNSRMMKFGHFPIKLISMDG